MFEIFFWCPERDAAARTAAGPVESGLASDSRLSPAHDERDEEEDGSEHRDAQH